MVLLADLPLTDCTESIQTTNINNSKELKRAGESVTDNRIPSQYAKRHVNEESWSMYKWFIEHKNEDKIRKTRKGCKYLIPNFIGSNGTPVFPISDSYARYTLIVHKPWRTYPTGLNWKDEFEAFINHPSCPATAKMPYERVRQRYFDGLCGYEPKASVVDHSNNPISTEDYEFVSMLGGPDVDVSDREVSFLETLDTGLDFEWDAQPKVR